MLYGAPMYTHPHPRMTANQIHSLAMAESVLVDILTSLWCCLGVVVGYPGPTVSMTLPT